MESFFVILHFLQDYGRRLRTPLDVASRVCIRHFPSRLVRLGSIRLCAVRHGSRIFPPRGRVLPPPRPPCAHSIRFKIGVY